MLFHVASHFVGKVYNLKVDPDKFSLICLLEETKKKAKWEGFIPLDHFKVEAVLPRARKGTEVTSDRDINDVFAELQRMGLNKVKFKIDVIPLHTVSPPQLLTDTEQEDQFQPNSLHSSQMCWNFEATTAGWNAARSTPDTSAKNMAATHFSDTRIKVDKCRFYRATLECYKGKKRDGAGGVVDQLVLKDHATIDVELESQKNIEESKEKKLYGPGGAANKMVLKDHLIIGVKSSENTGESKDKECDGAGVAVDKMVVQDCAIVDLGSPKITGRSTGSEHASAGKVAKYSDTGCSTREAEMASVEIPSSMAAVAKPISMWFDGLCPRKNVVDSRLICGRTVNQWNDAKGRQIEIAMKSTANESVSDRTPDEMYLEASSMLKAIIESLEVFQTMPQMPHFHPLKKCKEMYQEGLAIGYMVTFANVVKQTSKLQFNDPKSIFHSISETLFDLELHGFDVNSIRNRLTELQLMKIRKEQLQEESKEFECQITECTHKQTKIMREFDEVVREMKVLEERKTRIMMLKEKTDSKITELKLNLDVCNKDIQSVQLDFASLAAAPW